MRTCVACRGRAPRGELVRVVARGAGGERVLEPDFGGSAPGRGAWVHWSAACLSQAVERNAFRRSLRIPGEIRAELGEQLRTAVSDGAAQGALSTGARASLGM